MAAPVATSEATPDVAPLPLPRGPLSASIVTALAGTPGQQGGLPVDASAAEPYGDDLQLALQVCYELHYQGFAGVDPDWEWHPELLRARAVLERRFLGALRADTAGGADVTATLDTLLTEPVDDSGGLTGWLAAEGTWEQLREYLALRSIYHLKEADPHAFAIPRLRGQAKAALVAVEFDEFGGGHAERMHSRLYADLLTGAGLNPSYLGYLEHVPAHAFATVNLMSMLGLHRSLRGGLVGHFAAAEITTAPSAQRMVRALRRLGADESCVLFFSEHVEADAVHEQVLRREVIGDLLDREPELAADIVFGIQATELLEDRLAAHVLGWWRRGESALRQPLT
ncbi:heme oxygenase-like protein [Prauserella shujinwangii]|uniref:Heme oxygenase-like protein n=1 Tax=Prauserella shujinwangii TaxID=1453103 RepID=A0A2T0LX73_9PSEU|nr:iron-containing redox enzyme family protein [Prauserella shujinwangii]PRX48620.1 heme oxygenase-like protein [Prauserella shujinwangii]